MSYLIIVFIKGSEIFPVLKTNLGQNIANQKAEHPLVYDLIKSINKKSDNKAEIHFGLNHSKASPKFTRTYSLWEPFPAEKKPAGR